MEKRTVGRTGTEVFPLGFGMMRLPKTPDGKINEKKAIEIVRWAIDHGINYIDTAYNYHDGQSEIVTGKALLDGYREKVNLVTKCPIWKLHEPGDFDKVLAEQLEKLQTDHLDFYLLHAINQQRWDEILKQGILQDLLRAKKDGRVRHIGFSFHDRIELFKEMVDVWDQWDFCQIQLNYVDTHYQAGIEGLEYAASKGLGVVIMEPLRGGYLVNLPKNVKEKLMESGKSPIELAMDFLWNRPEVSLILSGMGTLEQIRENMEYANRSHIGMLCDRDLEILDEGAKMLRSVETIPCTGCNYCEVCPREIPIPKIFKAYNVLRTTMDLEDGKELYAEATKDRLTGDACIRCRACEMQCPQQIPIHEWMPKIHDLLK